MGYLFEVGCGFSIFINTIFGGSHKDTISNKLRKTKSKYNNTIPWSKPISKILAYILNIITPNHLN
jgi:hypothetical protein